MNTHRTIAAAVLLLAVAGCSAGGTSAASYSSPSAMASKLGAVCTGYAATTPTYYAKAEGGCGDATLDLVTFASDSNRDEWLHVAKLGGGNYVVGPKWVAGVYDSTMLAKVHAKLGGKVQS